METLAEHAKYSGGLIHSILATTLATQQQTLEMLKQRDGAWRFGIDLKYTIDGTPATFPTDSADLVLQLEQEILQARQKVAEAEADAGRYTGGLIRATLLTTAATGMQTLALLDQKRLSLKYGIPLYAASIDGAPPPVAATVSMLSGFMVMTAFPSQCQEKHFL